MALCGGGKAPGSIPALGKVPSLQGNNFSPPEGSGGTKSPRFVWLFPLLHFFPWILPWDTAGVVWILPGGLGTEGTGPGRASLQHLNTSFSGCCSQGQFCSPFQPEKCNSRDVPGMPQSSGGTRGRWDHQAELLQVQVGSSGSVLGKSETPFLGAGRMGWKRSHSLGCSRPFQIWMEPDAT